MTHQEIEKQEIIERYVRHQLAPDERRAFQEHYFACSACFDEVQLMTQFIAGVRQAARQGVLAERASAAPWWRAWFIPTYGFAAASLLLVVLFGWFWFKQSKAPKSEIAYQPTATPQAVASPAASLKLIEQPDLLAQNRTPIETPDKNGRDRSDRIEGRLPMVLLDSARGASVNQLTLPANATRAILRIETDPASEYTGYQFQIFDNSRRLIVTATSGKASRRGAVSASLSASPLQNGKYLVKCFGLKDGQRELVGEYDLSVRKP